MLTFVFIENQQQIATLIEDVHEPNVNDTFRKFHFLILKLVPFAKTLHQQIKVLDMMPLHTPELLSMELYIIFRETKPQNCWKMFVFL